MPDRIYRMTAARPLVYEVDFKRKSDDLHAVRTSDPAVHTAEIEVRKTAEAPEEKITVALLPDGPSREIPLGDTLLETYGTVRALVAEASPEIAAEKDLDGCALVFRARE